ncbi:Bud site selection protein 6 [Microbotryomycetes sp. JL201]|nr:Bud site selection protein 6 [Microbotryomycetes sp. JL201]
MAAPGRSSSPTNPVTSPSTARPGSTVSTRTSTRNGSVASVPPGAAGQAGTTAGSSRNSHSGHATTAPTSHMESTITRLLVATKQLLEGLAKWSRGEVTEENISDIYVKLGNDFNVACAAFQRENITMNELLSVPSDLRECLETCLSETPSQATLERHLPKVRQIIIGLLHGLREKQRQYRDSAAARRARERQREEQSVQQAALPQSATSHNDVGPSDMSRQSSSNSINRPTSPTATMRQIAAGQAPMTPNTAMRSKEELRKFVSQAQQKQSVSAVPSASAESQNASSGARNSLIHAVPSSSSSVVPSEVSSSNSSFVSVASRQEDLTHPQPHEPVTMSTRPTTSSRAGSINNRSVFPQELRRSVSEDNPSLSSYSTGASHEMGPPPANKSARTSGSLRESTRSSRTISRNQGHVESYRHSGGSFSSANRWSSGHPGSPPPPAREPEVLGPLPSSATTSPELDVGSTLTSRVSVSSAYDEPYTPTLSHSQSAAQLESLEALKQGDHLSRRASKRYSAYTIQKMTSPMRDGAGSSGGREKTSRANSSGEVSAGKELANEAHVYGSRHDRSTAGSAGVRRARTEVRPSKNGDGPRNLPPLPPIPAVFSNMDLKSSGSVQTITEEGSGGEDDGRVLRDATLRSNELTVPHSEAKSGSRTPSIVSEYSARNLDSPLPDTSSTEAAEPGDRTPNAHIDRNKAEFGPAHATTDDSDEQTVHYPISIFLQIGRDVKKVKLASPPGEISNLKLLFVEKFQYNPGQQDFPLIYVRDRDAGVYYELEDLSDVRNGSVLSLNIDTVEQVKAHIDNGLASLTQEMKELKSTVTAMRRVSISANTLLSPDLNGPSSTIGVGGTGLSSPIVRASPSERQFQDAANKVARVRRLGSIADISAVQEQSEQRNVNENAGNRAVRNAEIDTNTDAAPEATSAAAAAAAAAASSPTQSVSSDTYTAQVVVTLKQQHEQVSNLRHEIGVLRQVYLDFASQTKDMINHVRVQSSQVHKIAASKLSKDRSFVEAGTTKLDTDSTELVVKVDELSDTIEAIRADTVRGIRARPSQLSELKTQLNKLDKTRVDLSEWLGVVKPKWQELWSNELAKVLGEQERVQTQETLLNDLAVDLDDVRDVLGKVEIVSKQVKTSRVSSSTVGPTYGAGTSPDPERDDEQQSLNREGVLLQVQSLKPDPTKRLEAIEKAERQRQLELASRTDEFEQELSGFVQQNKLKKSGGIEETERRRQAQNQQTLKAMFS